MVRNSTSLIHYTPLPHTNEDNEIIGALRPSDCMEASKGCPIWLEVSRCLSLLPTLYLFLIPREVQRALRSTGFFTFVGPGARKYTEWPW